MKESGSLMQLQNKWWVDRSECPAEEEGGAETDDELSFSSLAGIFYILILGLGVALIVAAIEFCYNSRRAARKSQVTLFAICLLSFFKKIPRSQLQYNLEKF